MAKMDELYNSLYDYCLENRCWKAWNTVADWNSVLDDTFSAGSFTALVNAGKLEREKQYKANTYSYRLVPTGKILELMEEDNKQSEIESAKRTVEYYQRNIELIKSRYEEQVKQAEEYLERHLTFENEKYEKAKKLLGLN